MRAEPLNRIEVTPEGEPALALASSSRYATGAIKACLVMIDAALSAACFVGAYALREGESLIATGGAASGGMWSESFAPYAALLPLIVVMRLLTHAYYRLYRLRGEFAYVDEFARVFKATAVASLLIVAAAFLYRGGYEYRAFSYARGVFLLDFIFAFSTLR